MFATLVTVAVLSVLPTPFDFLEARAELLAPADAPPVVVIPLALRSRRGPGPRVGQPAVALSIAARN